MDGKSSGLVWIVERDLKRLDKYSAERRSRLTFVCNMFQISRLWSTASACTGISGSAAIYQSLLGRSTAGKSVQRRLVAMRPDAFNKRETDCIFAINDSL